jgi:methionine sulfoxide reductase heme-binding subunit
MERVARTGAFILCLLPFLWILFAAVSDHLGPDPAEALMLFTGEWSLRMLALTLLVSPLRAWTGWSLLMKLRRMLGLYAFFYGCVHFLTFLQFYIGWVPTALTEELVERPYITPGHHIHSCDAAPFA